MRASRLTVALAAAAGLALAGLVSMGLNGCSQTQLSTPAGALFCAVQTQGGGTMVVTVIDAEASAAEPGAAPVVVLATGLAKAQVDTDCTRAAAAAGALDAIPVSPPPRGVIAPPVAIGPASS